MRHLLTTRDIARILDISPDDANRLARKGAIKGHKVGRQWRFRVRDAKLALASLRDPAGAPGTPVALGNRRFGGDPSP